jgi:D-alanyl-D-alanine carboxypeptidase
MIRIAFMAYLIIGLSEFQLVRPANAATHDDPARSIRRRILETSTPLANGALLKIRDECPIKVSGNITCADLMVPERRNISGRCMVAVPIAILPAQDEIRHSDPFVFLMGGQGQGFSVLNDLTSLPALLGRDVITLQQRGTQLADPFFGCPEVESGVTGIDQVLTSQPSKANPQEIEKCKEAIEQYGVDRNGYDTAASADDLWDLKQLLGIEEWNLYGVSYGGRTAESFLRKHPDEARSLVLDSPQVTGIPFIFGYARLIKIGRFFAHCAAADRCGRHFPNLKEHFEGTVARLEREALPVTVAGKLQNLTAAAYIRVVTWILYTKPESAVTQLPAAIIAASYGNYAPLLALEDRYADALTSKPAQPGEYPTDLGSHIAQQTEVLCAEEYPHLPRHDEKLSFSFPGDWSSAVKRVAVAEQLAQAAVCDKWGFEPSDREQGRLPPSNDVPTLVVHGDHDTIAPSEDQDLLAYSYPRSTRVVFTWTGHAMSERRKDCFWPMLAAFVESPTLTVNTTCATAISEPHWLLTAPQAHEPRSFLPVMQTVAANQVQDYGFPGHTVSMFLDKAAVRGTVFVGLADPTSGRRLTGREPSRMASMTKTYTAAAALRLFEQGKVALDEGVGRYLTNETKRILESGDYNVSAITTRQLLQHTSGLPDYNDAMFKQRIAEEPHHRWDRREQLKWAMNHEQPTGTPGQVYSYSDTGYILVGEIIEQASGLSQAPAYRDLLSFNRLGIRHTWFESLESAPTDLPERAHQFYGSVDVTDLDPSFDLWGGGGLVATLDDEVTFLRSLMTGLVFEHSDTLRTMLTVPDTNTDAAYSMGIYRVESEGTVCWGTLGLLGHQLLSLPISQCDNLIRSLPGYRLVARLRSSANTVDGAAHQSTCSPPGHSQ